MNAIDLVNKTFSLRLENLIGIFRVIYVDMQFNALLLYPLTAKRKRPLTTDEKADQDEAADVLAISGKTPRRLPLDRFLTLDDFECQKIDIRLPPWTNSVSEKLTDLQKKKYLQLVARMSFFQDPSLMLKVCTGASYNQLIASKAKQLGVDRTTLARDASRFYLCEMDLRKAAMLGIFARGKPRSKRIVKNKLGRKPNSVKTGHLPKSRYENVNDLIKEKIRLHYFGQKDRSLPVAVLYRSFKSEFVDRPVDVLADGLIVRAPDPALNISEGQYRTQINKLRNPQQRDIAKFGLRKFLKDHRVLVGSARNGIQFPGQCYIIDSTIADVHLVSAFDRRRLIGRPVLYVVIDAFSSLIVSVHAALKGPNLDEAKVALYRAMTDKELLFESLGIPKSLLSAFPAGCKPLSIFADRGELLSDGSRKLAEAIDVRLSLAAPYRPDWKSIVERTFGILNQASVHWMPGAVRERVRERGERDTRHDATLTPNAFLRIILTLAAEWNMNHDMTKHISASMASSNVDATPLGLYNYGLEALHGSPHFLAREDAIRSILPLCSSSADRTGVHPFKNVRFTPTSLEDEEAFYSLRVQGKTDIYLDPDRPGFAYELDPSSEKLRTLKFVDERGYDELDVSLSDIVDNEAYFEWCREDAAPSRELVRATLAGLREKIMEEEAVATKAAKKTDGRSKSSRVSEIKKNRKAEANRSYVSDTTSKSNGSSDKQDDTTSDEWKKTMEIFNK